MKLIFLGMNGAFSVPPFRALLSAGLKPAALVIPAPVGMGRQFGRLEFPPPRSTMAGGGLNLLELAARHEIPIYEVGSLKNDRALEWVRTAGKDLLVTACFPRLLPPEWLDAPRLGALNLHPSLLPAYRGPQPLFWQFRAGEQDTGVSLHFMDAGADTGDIVAQARVHFQDGIGEPEAERLTGEAGAGLLLEALDEPERMPRRPQPEAGASRQPEPSRQDLRIPSTWSARRAFNFMRGAQAWGPFEVQQANAWVRVAEAQAFQHGPAEPQRQPELGGGWLRFQDGAVLVRFAGPP